MYVQRNEQELLDEGGLERFFILFYFFRGSVT